ncbi:V-type ATP synthase subunit E [Chloroflexota bacterium]
MSMEKISEAILDKVKVEAADIIKDAEEKAKERIERAKEQHEARLGEEKRKLVEGAEGEAARIQAQASITAREELLDIKNKVINEIVGKVKEALSDISGEEKLSLNLIKEAIEATDVDKARVYVSKKDIDGLQKLVKADKELAGRITEINEYKCEGGAIIEDIEGTISIDNTFETRLEMLMSRILPEIGKELFGD